jgi:hypothetical protein
MRRLGLVLVVLTAVGCAAAADDVGGSGGGGSGGTPANGGSGGTPSGGGSGGSGGSGGTGETGGSGGTGETGGSGGTGETGGSGGTGGSGPLLHRVGLFDIDGITQLSVRTSADLDHLEVRLLDDQGAPVEADLDFDGTKDGPVSIVDESLLPVGADGLRNGGVATSDATREGAVEARVIAVGEDDARSAEVVTRLVPLPRPRKGEACDPSFNFDLCAEGLICRSSVDAFACDEF